VSFSVLANDPQQMVLMIVMIKAAAKVCGANIGSIQNARFEMQNWR
jgi:hypothetical protein